MKNFIFVVSVLLLAACGNSDDHSHADQHHTHDESAATTEPAKGPHRGRLLRDGDVTVEVAIFETGVPPEFRVYVTQADKPVAPAAVKLTIELTRLGGAIDRFSFVPESDYLKGTGSVVEPHSFDVKVMAELAGKQYVWTYASYEGRTTITADMAAEAGIKTAVAGPGVLRDTIRLHGSIVPNAERVRSVIARFPGPIRAVTKPIGAVVKAGETLATVESNDSLQTYAVTAPIAGVITERHANAGEVAGSEPLFVISDFSSVWAELTFFARDRARIQVGQRVKVTAVDADLSGEGVIAHIAPSGSDQTLTARVALTNTDTRWIPGLFVSGVITAGESAVPLLVANSALQGFRDFAVVFAQIGDSYEVRMLELGRSDGDMTEVRGGLDPGTVYVTGNSYLIKADIEKSGASHDH
ncbi:MAG: efflux RND transporter periplasmic adaptor subunit [Spongiibacteraceae bacterium]